MKVEATILFGGGSGRALDGVGSGGAVVEAGVADGTMGNEAEEGGGGDGRMVGGREERHVDAGGSVPGEEDGADVACCWADGCFVFEQCPLLAGRQVVQALRAFTHAQFLHFPSRPLHRQQAFRGAILHAFFGRGIYYLWPRVPVNLVLGI